MSSILDGCSGLTQHQRLDRDPPSSSGSGTLTRRSLLAGGIAGLAALAAARADRALSSTRSWWSAPPPLRLQRPGEASCFLLGDSGARTESRNAVIERLAQVADSTRDTCIVLLGDNFYPAGVRDRDDPLWLEHFEHPFDERRFRMPFFAALGNHDHRGEVQAQLDYGAAHGRWHMPARNYTFERKIAGAAPIGFFVLDTSTLIYEESRAVQVAWLESELRRSAACWKVVVGHHPILTGGAHGPTPCVEEWIAPVLARERVDLYVSGHEHDQQLLRAEAGWLQVVSGAVSSPRRTRRLASSLHARSEPGFVWLVASERELHLQYLSADDGLEFAHTLERS